jgi:hypothetical protein
VQDNLVRARHGADVVLAFAHELDFGDVEDWETVVGDLVTDLRHFCDLVDENFRELVERGLWHYRAELAGDGYGPLEIGDELFLWVLWETRPGPRNQHRFP